jgi:hypothetical protein
MLMGLISKILPRMDLAESFVADLKVIHRIASIYACLGDAICFKSIN